MKFHNETELRILDTKTLHRIFLDIRGKINDAHKVGKNVKDLEIYYCYLSREIEYRNNFKNTF